MYRPLEFVDRCPHLLHGQCRQTDKAGGPLACHGGNLIVHLTCRLLPLGCLQIIAKERRGHRDDLDIDLLLVHIAQAFFRGETQLGRRRGVAPGSPSSRGLRHVRSIPRTRAAHGPLSARLGGIRCACISIVRIGLPPVMRRCGPAYNPRARSRFFQRMASFSSWVRLARLSIQETGQSNSMS